VGYEDGDDRPGAAEIRFGTSSISSSARTTLSSGSAAQRRNCSRRAPSHVAKLQSIDSKGRSVFAIVFEPHPQVLDVDLILWACRC